MQNEAFINRLLTTILTDENWRVKKKIGITSEAFIVHGQDRSLFIKLDVQTDLIRRLGDLDLIPPIIQLGEFEGTSYVIQDYIEGVHPDQGWIENHLTELAKIIKTYHHDSVLQETLQTGAVLNCKKHIEFELQQIETEIENAKISEADVMDNYLIFAKQSEEIAQFSFVPIHTNANSSNFLIANNHIYVVDWGSMILSDELRDIGPLLWRYVAEARWSELLQAYGMEFSEHAKKRIYWWMAKQSISNAITFYKEKNTAKYQECIEDFKKNLQYKENLNRS